MSAPKPTCSLCGHEVAWGWDVGSKVRCNNCGAEVIPRPVLVDGQAKVPVPGCECVPFIPAGTRVYHSRNCRVSRNVPLSRDEEVAWNERKSMLRHPVSSSPKAERPLRIVEDEAYQDYWSDRDD